VLMLSLDLIREAAERARAHVIRTPVVPIADGKWLKLELLQPTGSFKVRGFFAAALALPPERLERGLLTVSAGNAALACAHVAQELGVRCRVVMFDSAPEPKLTGVRQLGGEPILMPRDRLFAWMGDRGAVGRLPAVGADLPGGSSRHRDAPHDRRRDDRALRPVHARASPRGRRHLAGGARSEPSAGHPPPGGDRKGGDRGRGGAAV